MSRASPPAGRRPNDPARRRLIAGGAALAALSAAPPGAAGSGGGGDIDAALSDLVYGDRAARRAAMRVVDRHDAPDIAASLILALRYGPGDRLPLVEALSRVTGHHGPDDWFGWMLWQEAHPEIVPRESHVALKRGIFLAIDPNFAAFLRPEHIRRDRMGIRFEEITWGGVAKDGIPSLDSPVMIDAADAAYLGADDLVFGISIGGDARAYPLRILGWHEMMNDVVGGVPVALAYCTLCGAGILFETAVEGRERPFVFGSSGFLYRSNKLMFDRETHSLWNQFTGRPVVGPLADSGIRLAERPIAIARWADWRRDNPGSSVLSIATGHRRDYGPGVVYREYFASPELMFPALGGNRGGIAPKDHVFGIRTFGGAKAWPIAAFEGGRVINDRVGDMAVVLAGQAAGRTVRAYNRGAKSFSQGPRPGLLRDAQGGLWEIGEDALLGPGGARAPRIAGHVSYWFAWDGVLGARSELYEGG